MRFPAAIISSTVLLARFDMTSANGPKNPPPPTAPHNVFEWVNQIGSPLPECYYTDNTFQTLSTDLLASPGQGIAFQGAELWSTTENGLPAECFRINICHGTGSSTFTKVTVSRNSLKADHPDFDQ